MTKHEQGKRRLEPGKQIAKVVPDMNRKERTVFVTILINVILIGFKFWLASASGSLALRSSAMHSLTDLAIGVFVLLGLFFSRGEAAKLGASRHFGLVENWVAIAVSAAIFYVGIDIVREVLGGEVAELRNLVPITLASLITVGVAYVIARYKLYVGQQTGSPALMASGYHSQVDIYASIVVVAGLAGAALGLPNLDTAAAAVVAVLIFLSGYQIASSALAALKHRRLLDLEGETGEPIRPGRNWWRLYGPAAGAALGALYLLSGVYTVQPGEVAVVRRFGAVIEQAGPGLHYRWPTPIETVDTVATDLVRQLETRPTQMLTGDENLISVRASLHYSVDDPAAFVLNVAKPGSLVMQAAVAALRQVVAGEAVDALLTVDKAAIQEQTATIAQAALDRSQSGIRVVGVQLLESAPPPEVAESFREVASAREDRNTFINEAVAYQNEIVPVARGDADRTTQMAAADSANKMASAKGEAAIFVARQAGYAAAPDITRQRLYLEAIERSLPGARKFLLDPAISPETTDLWIPGSTEAQILPQKP
ncbi:MAG: FtsH protease activity modulator HflK [Alphaproteobacteria bacterium]